MQWGSLEISPPSWLTYLLLALCTKEKNIYCKKRDDCELFTDSAMWKIHSDGAQWLTDLRISLFLELVFDKAQMLLSRDVVRGQINC